MLRLALTSVSIIAVLGSGNVHTEVEYGGEVKLQGTFDDVVLSPLPAETIKTEDLPVGWDWREKGGVLSTDLNQHIPVYCGSCWAHATMSTIGDRLKIAAAAAGNPTRDILPSIQAILNCGTAGSCGGGDIHAAFRWVHFNRIPDTTCQAYEAIDNACTPVNLCRTCGSNCTAITSYPTVGVKEYGRVIGDTNIQKEIMARGPVACYLNANCLHTYEAGTIEPYDDCKPYLFNHAVQLNGWGVEDGVEYWIGRNSWGTYWGDRGFFRIVRGGAYNPIGCYWGVPDTQEAQ